MDFTWPASKKRNRAIAQQQEYTNMGKWKQICHAVWESCIIAKKDSKKEAVIRILPNISVLHYTVEMLF